MSNNPFEDVNSQIDSIRTKENAELSEANRKRERFLQLFDEAALQHDALIRELVKRLAENTSHAEINQDDGLAVKLLVGQLNTDSVSAANITNGFDVVAYSAIQVVQPDNMYNFKGRCHSLWFCDIETEGNFQWYELGFRKGVFTGLSTYFVPYNLSPNDGDAFQALSMVMGGTDIAYHPSVIEPHEFIDRWLRWFASAAKGELSQDNDTNGNRLVIRNRNSIIMSGY